MILAVTGAISSGSALCAEEQSAKPVTFEDAVARYKAGDMAEANRDFLLLADAGLATADLNLSVMAVRGEGGAPNLGEAFGWLTAAQQLGAQVSEAQLRELSDGAGPEGRSRADAIVARYGRQAVANRLKDALSACRKSRSTSVESPPDLEQPATRTPPKTLTMAPNPWKRYPTEGLERGFPSAVFVRFLVDLDGRGKHPTISSSFPISWREGFQEAADLVVMHGRYEPATLNGRPIAAWKTIKVAFQFFGDKEMIEDSAIQKLRAATDQSDPVAEALWVVLTDAGVIAYDKHTNRADDDTILVSSALKGYAESEAILFERLCEPQHRAAWWIRAATDGAPRVLGPIIEAAYDRMFEPREHSEIIRLLDKAASSEDPALVRDVVWVRASARDPQLRDAQIALQLALSLHPQRRSDPDFDLALAAAQAAGGDFPAAQGTQERALDKAKLLGWDVAPLRATLKNYESKQLDPTVPAELRLCKQHSDARSGFSWTSQCPHD